MSSITIFVIFMSILVPCPMSILRNTQFMSFVCFTLSLDSMLLSHVNFKKWPCRCVEFKGQELRRVSADIVFCPSQNQLTFNTPITKPSLSPSNLG